MQLNDAGSNFPKPKRNKIPRSKQHPKSETCELCGIFGYTERHHIKTRGSGGGDEPENLIDLCWKCHHEKVESGKVPQDLLFGIAKEREHEQGNSYRPIN